MSVPAQLPQEEALSSLGEVVVQGPEAGPLRRWAAAALLAVAGACHAQVPVAVPTADVSRGPGLMLKGFWFQAPVAQAAPAVVLLHGCSGPYDRHGRLGSRMVEYAELFNRLGVHAMVLDSFTPRGEKEICTSKPGTRLITQAHRRIDALSALEWLAARPDVDASRLGLVGWSNGGSTVLAATNGRTREVALAPHTPAFAVAFYPGCEQELRQGYRATTRLLMLLGGADDWTPAEPCTRLARQSGGVEMEVYPGAHHAFDSNAPVRLRTDVPGGAKPGQGVHVGGDPAAYAQARARLERFMAEVLKAKDLGDAGR